MASIYKNQIAASQQVRACDVSLAAFNKVQWSNYHLILQKKCCVMFWAILHF